jgi:hypothetical protein
METRRRVVRYATACLMFSLISGSIGEADDRARDRASLRGLMTIIVKVHTFEQEWTSELAKAGMTEAVVQSTIERQLEKSGIKVIPEEASRQPETEGVLNVRVKFLNSKPPRKTFTTSTEDQIERIDLKAKLVYAIRLNLRQPVSMARRPEVKVNAITWQTESVGFRRLALIREDFTNVVNVFIEAYLSENPDSN